MEHDSEALISIQNANKKYGHITALKKMSLDIYKGQALSIFGSNGAGKSTLLKILSMQTKVTKGDVFYQGVPIKKLGDDFRRNFGVISHQPFVYDNLSAIENLEFYGSLYNVSNAVKIGEELLKKLDLYTRRHDPVRTFSRGMLQRISIARALIHSPNIIFLDEPYTGLDSVAAGKLTNLLKEQLSDSKTVIMVTHDVHTGLDLASDVIIMKKGEIVYQEKRENIEKADFEKIYIEKAGNMEQSK